jgi:Na/Pi-cotransporter
LSGHILNPIRPGPISHASDKNVLQWQNVRDSGSTDKQESMTPELDIWRLAAGLGLFLFGMHELEEALKQLAGRPFKRFLRQYTAKPLRGIIAGALTTAALQSSSVVSLIVLAFVGTGIITLASAISIVFGSNLGTTATGWIVATVGFKLDIEALALPLIAMGGFGVVWSAKGTRRAGLSHFVAGLGLMLMGLEFMKSGALIATELFDPAQLAGFPLIVFLVTGLLLTAVIQSSSATIMITLSALYAGAMTLESAAAIAIGADLGTTITAMLGALAGSTDKKRVAAAIEACGGRNRHVQRGRRHDCVHHAETDAVRGHRNPRHQRSAIRPGRVSQLLQPDRNRDIPALGQTVESLARQSLYRGRTGAVASHQIRHRRCAGGRGREHQQGDATSN